jgi:hypothetical protein
VSLLSQSLRTLGLLVLTACGTSDSVSRINFYAVDVTNAPYAVCSTGSWDLRNRRQLWEGRRSGKTIDGRVRFTVLIPHHWDHDSVSVACVGSSDTVAVALGPFVHGTATIERVVVQRDSSVSSRP